jgi:tRNA (guanine37-N1)-methyltransferase
MLVDILTLFPEMFQGPFEESIIKRAREKALVDIRLHDLREYANDKHRTVDDYPYGGGSGMVLKPEPIKAALDALDLAPSDRVIFLTPEGERLTQSKANELSLEKRLVLLCGHYKGVDERIRQKYVTDEISIGDYVLTGGELPAMVLVDAVARLIPGILGDAESALGDSFQDGMLDCPWYTRPRVFEGMEVPSTLCSGSHQEIEAWRHAQALRRTYERRPDLLDEPES